MNDKKNEKIANLQEDFNKIQDNNKDLDINVYLAKMGDLPDFGQIEIYDYESDMELCKTEATKVLNSMVNLYLSDAPHIKNDPYIIAKVENDAKVYAKALFLDKMGTKQLITQQRQVDNGDNNARMYEVMNQTMGEYRDNIKFSLTLKSELEKYWKEIRKDFGLNEMQAKQKEEIIDEDTEPHMIMDSRKMIEFSNYLKNKK